MLLIPTIPLNQSFTQTIILGGVSLGLSFRWNTRDDSWYLDILNNEGGLIKGGLKLVQNILLGNHYQTELPYQLAFMIMSEGAKDIPATFEGLGINSQLYVITPEDI